ncbi:MAG: FtsX-like permease family protein [Spirochaetaceae bacterium]|nr:FtsX-like permease family protein [Spirochaetaceae bacterium]
MKKTIKGIFFISIRYLLGRAKEGGRYLRGAVAGIALSLVPIIVTLLVADGMIAGIMDRYLELGYGHLQLYPRALENGEGLQIPEELHSETISVSGLFRGFWRERDGTGLVSGAGGKAGTTIRAVDPGFWTEEGAAKFLRVVSGTADFATTSSTDVVNTVLLGQELAENVQAAVGDTVYLMSLRSGSEGQVIPRTIPFTVAGIVSSGYRELDAAWCIISWESGLRLLSPDYSSSYIVAKIRAPYNDAYEAAHLIRSALGNTWSLFTWQNIMGNRYSSYESTRQMLLFIMALVVLVAAVNVSSSTSMLVIERRRDIAILKAYGASPGQITAVFLMCSFLTGLLGALIGLALGLFIGINVNSLLHGLEQVLSFFSNLFHGGDVRILDPGFYLETIPVVINWHTVALIGTITVLFSMLAALLPARDAGKLKSLDLLRKI